MNENVIVCNTKAKKNNTFYKGINDMCYTFKDIVFISLLMCFKQ